VDVPTPSYASQRIVPETRNVRTFEHRTTVMPTSLTTYRIAYKDELRTRTRNVVEAFHSPLVNLKTNCNCFSPTCGCVGIKGCGCCYPGCSCAPTPQELATSYSTTPVTENYVVRIPYKVPVQEGVDQIINQNFITNTPETTFPNRPELSYVNRPQTRFSSQSVKSSIPDTVEECWNEPS